jgi:hypothetical protein
MAFAGWNATVVAKRPLLTAEELPTIEQDLAEVRIAVFEPDRIRIRALPVIR